MNFLQSYRINSPTVVSEVFDDEIVVIHLEEVARLYQLLDLEQGTHETLLVRNGLYRRLVQAQQLAEGTTTGEQRNGHRQQGIALPMTIPSLIEGIERV